MKLCRSFCLTTVLLLFSFALISTRLAYSQAARGSISGEVHDPSGSVIPNVAVKLVEVRTNQEYQGKTDDNGLYTILNLVPGSYSLTDGSRWLQKAYPGRDRTCHGRKTPRGREFDHRGCNGKHRGHLGCSFAENRGRKSRPSHHQPHYNRVAAKRQELSRLGGPGCRSCKSTRFHDTSP